MSEDFGSDAARGPLPVGPSELLPVRTYSVTVCGFAPAQYNARTPSQARAIAYRAYSECRRITFREFLQICSVRRWPNSRGVGDLIIVDGKPARRCLNSSGGHYVHYTRDGGRTVLVSHPADVTQAEGRPEGPSPQIAPLSPQDGRS